MTDRPVAKHAPVAPQGSWTALAACRGHDPDLWFLDDRTGSYGEARAICAACAVRIECLEDAVETNTTFGMWGGLAPLERQRIRRHSRAPSVCR